MPSARLTKLREWWDSSYATVIESTWEARFWAGIGILGIFWQGLSSSIAVVFFMSAWANAKAARIQRAEAQREMVQEEAIELGSE